MNILNLSESTLNLLNKSDLIQKILDLKGKVVADWIQITIYFYGNNQQKKFNIIVGTIYRDPKMDVIEFNNILNNLLKKLIKNKKQCIF